VFVQKVSLGMVWTRVALDQHSIAGETVAPFFTQRFEGVDLNGEADSTWTEALVARGVASLPLIAIPSWLARR
jgi:hypothetical protein